MKVKVGDGYQEYVERRTDIFRELTVNCFILGFLL